MTTTLMRRGGAWRIADANDIYDALPPGVYILGRDMHGFFLSDADPFELPDRLYGSTAAKATRILRTFKSRPLMTGVLLEGEKGSGKSLLAKVIAAQAIAEGMPTIIIGEDYHGPSFNSFMQQLHQPCVLLFDEFEKVYNDKEAQADLLTFLDGTVPTRKLCILTVNESWGLDRNLMNRPGRLFYTLSFYRMEEDFIREYVTAQLTNGAHIEATVRAATTYANFNFDQLKALVEEMNRYDEDPYEALQWLNIRPSYESDRTFTMALYDKHGNIVKGVTNDVGEEARTWKGNPLAVGNDRRSLSFSWRVAGEEREDNDGDPWKSEDFEAHHLTKADNGSFWFKNNNGYTLHLTPKKIEAPAAAFGYGS